MGVFLLFVATVLVAEAFLQLGGYQHVGEGVQLVIHTAVVVFIVSFIFLFAVQAERMFRRRRGDGNSGGGSLLPNHPGRRTCTRGFGGQVGTWRQQDRRHVGEGRDG